VTASWFRSGACSGIGRQTDGQGRNRRPLDGTVVVDDDDDDNDDDDDDGRTGSWGG